ncbi:hypothetical protein [Natronobacterium gregoryi]|uniref:Uncharacterized protein n=2 Tax=Natronobacterium gregoryi TaxID=44930 RepID=L0AL59_NATGS|nr:hypothetical protein [Natronobacterium gregoryi]AFZ73932.1 hypothetical protein Natgr_2788 [Natronobacterium gregoryi SP2]ELY71732.1 hypothetical protein C490_04827 [Natronobacterium gregoryi SP2]PLK19512.1 hypothetical protein CYV19_14295 [Natronobacterium gregoryi SP2]SFJ46860.1 hypothetical protein SAMN05443661_1326 [Natronobacterium gregoryi]
MASSNRPTSKRTVIVTIGSALALGATGYRSTRKNDRADDPATEPTRTATSDERDDPSATGAITDATDDEGDCGCHG